jgi:hypothetical protein
VDRRDVHDAVGPPVDEPMGVDSRGEPDVAQVPPAVVMPAVVMPVLVMPVLVMPVVAVVVVGPGVSRQSGHAGDEEDRPRGHDGRPDQQTVQLDSVAFRGAKGSARTHPTVDAVGGMAHRL